jgi:hypothetical protein
MADRSHMESPLDRMVCAVAFRFGPENIFNSQTIAIWQKPGFAASIPIAPKCRVLSTSHCSPAAPVTAASLQFRGFNMNRSQFVQMASVATLIVVRTTSIGHAGDWPKLLDHPPAGANTIALFNGDALRFGAAKLKQLKTGDQQVAADNLLADLPEHAKRAAVSANIDFDSLEPIWESAAVIFESKIPNLKGIADREGGYIDQISGKSVVWSPRGRYYVPHGSDRVDVHLPANRPAVARWIRSLGQSSQPLADYLKRAAEHALDGTALLLAVDMADTISPVQAAAKLATLKSVSAAKVSPESLAKLLGDLRGMTFTVTVTDQFMGHLQLDFGSSPALLSESGQGMLVEACSRRGILLPELREWKSSVERNAFVLNGPLDAISVVNLLSFFNSTPSSNDSHYESPSGTKENSGPDSSAKMAQASRKYFGSTQRILQECRNTKGLSAGERGVFNDRLSRKIDQLPLLNVDKDLLDYGANVAQLLRGAGLAIRSASVAAGGQKATQATSTRSVGYAFSSYSFNDNTAYNESLTNQAHAEGMQQHLGNMQQVDTLTAEIRRQMTERYMIEF